MKQPRALTRTEKQMLSKIGMDVTQYLAVTHTPECFTVVKRGTKDIVNILPKNQGYNKQTVHKDI